MDKKRLAIGFLIVLTNAMGATAILPMLPLYAEGQFQAGPFQALLVIPLYYAAQFVAAPWLGRLSDRFGRRPILIVSQIGTIVSYLLFIFAVPLGEPLGLRFGMNGGLLVVYLARLLDGLTGGNVSAAEAYASDISDERSRAQALGLIGGAVGIGHILGPALALALSGISLIAPMFGALALSGVPLLLTVLFLDETLAAERRQTGPAGEPGTGAIRLLANRSVTLVLGTAFIMGLYIATLLSSFSIYAERVLFPGQPAQAVIQRVSLLVTISGLIASGSQIFLIGPLARRLGEQRLFVIGCILLLGSALGISSGSLGLVPGSVVLYALGYAMSWPSLQTILTRLGSMETVGRLLGLFQSAFSLAFILSPLLAGLALENSGPRAIFQGGAGLMALAAALGILILRLPLRSDVSSARSPAAGAHGPAPERAGENPAG